MRNRRMNSSALTVIVFCCATATIVLPAEADFAIRRCRGCGCWKWRRDAYSGRHSRGPVRVPQREAWRRRPNPSGGAAPSTAGRRSFPSVGPEAEKNCNLPGGIGLLQMPHEQPSEQAGQNPNRQEISAPAGDPPGPVRREPAAGHEAMYVRVMQESSTPKCGGWRKSRSRHPDVWDRRRWFVMSRRRSEIECHRRPPCSGRAMAAVLSGSGENNMKVLGVEQLGTPIVQPLGAAHRLAFRATASTTTCCKRCAGDRSCRTARRGHRAPPSGRSRSPLIARRWAVDRDAPCCSR